MLLKVLTDPFIEKHLVFIIFFSISNIYSILLPPFAGGSRLLDAMALVFLYNYTFKTNRLIPAVTTE